MDHDKDPRPESGADQPADWDRKEMKPDFGKGADAEATEGGPEAPDWKEGQMARERPDGTKDPGPSEAEIAASQGGLSGGGSNPGGGRQWAERDTEDDGE